MAERTPVSLSLQDVSAAGARRVRPRTSALPGLYVVASYAAVLALCGRYVAAGWPGEGGAAWFLAAVYLTYALIYLVPALLIVLLCDVLLVRRIPDPAAWRLHTVRAIAVTATGATLLLLWVDQSVFGIFGYHLNGFVWNVVTTRGGLESMGSGGTTAATVAAIAGGVLLLQAATLWLLVRLDLAPLPKRTARLCLVLFVLLTAGERAAYGLCHACGNAPVMIAADAFPWYSRLTFDRLAARMGIADGELLGPSLDVHGGLVYPLAELNVEPPAEPLNVVWLVSESWRADALDPLVMPRVSSFAPRTRRFDRHYSGGNGTRMGMFTMFYGLYGSSWFHVLDERRPPLLLDALRRQDYQMDIRTSARFTYPEFDRTIFSGVDDDDLHEQDEGFGWERDRRNVTEMLEFMEQRDPGRPFFAFQFFESPHARYTYPEECRVFTPCADEINYAALDLERDIEGIRNRYLNSCRHLDQQMGRVLDFLEQRGLLERTIVVLTGDHGEEFLEHGTWGHGSSFVDEQTRVPLLLWIPGVEPGVSERMTSHLDLPATLLPHLGVRGDEAELSLGHDLLGPFERQFTVICDWNRLCYVDAETKAWFDLKRVGLLGNQITTADDRPGPDRDAFLASHGAALAEVMSDLARFRRRSGSPSWTSKAGVRPMTESSLAARPPAPESAGTGSGDGPVPSMSPD